MVTLISVDVCNETRRAGQRVEGRWMPLVSPAAGHLSSPSAAQRLHLARSLRAVASLLCCFPPTSQSRNSEPKQESSKLYGSKRVVVFFPLQRPEDRAKVGKRRRIEAAGDADGPERNPVFPWQRTAHIISSPRTPCRTYTS
ncbi:hypothetical protein KOW79_020332 [Hemibagrus wyckioides]|uniref:Uncharacterized protein n=1 Tax=Hemibagrus wyckioides TaxID=337641 RepID=A0A9D3S9W4_9TELE|nr:hypothetical protein KOW79_020332 [Hemibagrus wyckioides]